MKKIIPIFLIGVLWIAAWIATSKIYDAFLTSERNRVFQIHTADWWNKYRYLAENDAAIVALAPYEIPPTKEADGSTHMRFFPAFGLTARPLDEICANRELYTISEEEKRLIREQEINPGVGYTTIDD